MREKTERVKPQYVKLYDESVVYKILGTTMHKGEEMVVLKHYNMKWFKLMNLKEFVIKCMADNSYEVSYPNGRKKNIGRFNRVGDIINGSF